MKDLSPLGWALRPLKKYADFSGRAPRAEYWWYAVLVTLVGVPLNAVERRLMDPVWGDYGPFSLLLILALVSPLIAVTVRRLHDIDRTGWWALARLPGYSLVLAGIPAEQIGRRAVQLPTLLVVIAVVVYLGCSLTLFVFEVTRGTTGQNAYGPDPYGPDPLETVFV
jgi:uncharacterized membrane protein YhaH (DUF805 family)